MSSHVTEKDNIHKHLSADCENCFGLCCVALPYAKSADFAFTKSSGTPCQNLQADFKCGIHNKLRKEGFRGCSTYECFGAGQKVSQNIYAGKDWRNHPELANEMFSVFPIMQQLHEMLCYLNEALHLEVTKPIHKNLQAVYDETQNLTNLSPDAILALDIVKHRVEVNELLLQTSELVRSTVPNKKKNKMKRNMDLIGSNLKGADLRGANLRGALFIAANLTNADLRKTDLIGADFRDADLSGANLTGSIFLTQAQVNSAKGNQQTKLPPTIKVPDHWNQENTD